MLTAMATESASLGPGVRGAIEEIAAQDPLVALAEVAALRRVVDDLERHGVAQARYRGRTWREIAEALGVTKQTAHRKYVDKRSR
jgi:predicted transcriptional regulator